VERGEHLTEPAEARPSHGHQSFPAPRPHTVALVSCVKRKAPHPRPARDLYISPLFRWSRQVAERASDQWFILSALYHLAEPDLVISPYEKTLKGAPRTQKRDWARAVFEEFQQKVHFGARIVILAGLDYTEYLVPMIRNRGHEVLEPLAGLSQGRRVPKLKAIIADLNIGRCL
jgi:hypothetical protein